ncbi:MBL fold metallo-hydrolase [Rhizobium lusitanum]|uniref:MBL fold metallo-hydrolase n=1 Tax=Rhizobium lusitanum TaxID=293958 RepID=UPI00191E3F60|nr:MBL fold metallo-hydrolase [Rhizobium lusitanum]
MIGAFEVTALSDGTAEMPMDELLSEPGEKTREVLKEAHLDTPMEMSVNAYLINTGDRLILVDTGSGDGLGSSLGKLPKNIIAAGYKPDQIDDILLTHLHPDHVGGLVRNGAAVFPNAKIHASRVEATFWLSPSNAASVSNQAGFVTSVQASLAPYVASGRFQPFDGDAEVVSYVRARKAEGHTPGSVVYVIESNRERLLLIGDLIHAGPVQFADPAITFAFDSDPAKAANARRNVLGQAAADGDMIGAAHLPFPGLGYVRRELDAYRWLSINYSITFH